MTECGEERWKNGGMEGYYVLEGESTFIKMLGSSSGVLSLFCLFVPLKLV